MRKSAEEKEESRRHILKAASELFRKNGIDGASVNDVMKKAGMTHGGFYRHFASKEELVAAAIGEARKEVLSVFGETTAKRRREVKAYIGMYLSTEHAASPQKGCPLASMGVEAARGPAAWRDAMAESVEEIIARLREGSETLSEDEALELFSTMVGSVVLARAVGESPYSERILKATRRKALEKVRE